MVLSNHRGHVGRLPKIVGLDTHLEAANQPVPSRSSKARGCGRRDKQMIQPLAHSDDAEDSQHIGRVNDMPERTAVFRNS
jgi:hypothetical protein